MKNKKIVIVGLGQVGNLENNILYTKYEPDFIDKSRISFINNIYFDNYNQALDEAKKVVYDLAVICVSTPLDSVSGLLDCTEVLNAVNDINADRYLIKSTVNVGTCDEIMQRTNKKLIHSPEFSGSTQHANNFDYNFTILGGDPEDCNYIQQIYQEVYDATHIYRYVDRKTAETIKLSLNFILASKVSLFSVIWDFCKQHDVQYENVRQCLGLDPRINLAHTSIYDEHPFWDSHCFNKDVPAFTNDFDNKFANSILVYNELMKVKYKD